MRHVALMSLLVVLVLSPARAEDEPPMPNEGPWRVILSDQLKGEKACDLNEVLTYQEVPLGNDVGVDGRVSCIDGREFNFTRKGKNQKFLLEVCSPAVC